MPVWDLDHLLQFQRSSKVVLVTRAGVELKGGIFKVPLTQEGKHPEDLIL